jgi:hypothetical protein
MQTKIWIGMGNLQKETQISEIVTGFVYCNRFSSPVLKAFEFWALMKGDE